MNKLLYRVFRLLYLLPVILVTAVFVVAFALVENDSWSEFWRDMKGWFGVIKRDIGG